MEHKLISLFIMRDGGVKLNDIPKMQCDIPIVDNQYMTFNDSDLQVPSQWNGTFSYFNNTFHTVTEQ
eukprot:3266707-Ditylum_brightwellii.AAC.2